VSSTVQLFIGFSAVFCLLLGEEIGHCVETDTAA